MIPIWCHSCQESQIHIIDFNIGRRSLFVTRILRIFLRISIKKSIKSVATQLNVKWRLVKSCAFSLSSLFCYFKDWLGAVLEKECIFLSVGDESVIFETRILPKGEQFFDHSIFAAILQRCSKKSSYASVNKIDPSSVIWLNIHHIFGYV